MITKAFIWWHRRRAVFHDAMKMHTQSIWHTNYSYHVVKRDWHLKQIERLQTLNKQKT